MEEIPLPVNMWLMYGYPVIDMGFYGSQVVVWDFWTINSRGPLCIVNVVSTKKPSVQPIKRDVFFSCRTIPGPSARSGSAVWFGDLNIPKRPLKPRVYVVGGLLKYFFYVHPEKLGKWFPIWLAHIFQIGWNLKPQTSLCWWNSLKIWGWFWGCLLGMLQGYGLGFSLKCWYIAEKFKRI